MLTERQQREIHYHRSHAESYKRLLNEPFSYDAVSGRTRRWWNASWCMYRFLAGQELTGKRVLIAGCGFGDDALRLAKLGCEVYAFDLSRESLEIAKALALRERLHVTFNEMRAERLDYHPDFFDCVVARDILHHVDIPLAVAEIVRVSKNSALCVINELYSHSVTDYIRHSRIVEDYLYPRMKNFVYGTDKPYITADERKLTETDVRLISAPIASIQLKRYFNFLVTRIVPERFDWMSQLDQFMLWMLHPFAHMLAGRILLAGRISK